MSVDRGRHAVFLDRDGVLNQAVIRGDRPFPPTSTHELEIPEDASASLQALRRAGYTLVAVTNQPDVARGTQLRENVEAINREIKRRLPLDDFRVCYHDSGDGCECRKPKPGMILDSAHSLALDPARSVMIGDRWSDIEAGRRAGCRTVLIGNGYGEANPWHAVPDAQVQTLTAATAWILGHEKSTV